MQDGIEVDKALMDEINSEEVVGGNELRKASFLIGKYDPCYLCVNARECGLGGGCLGWYPDEETCRKTIKT